MDFWRAILALVRRKYVGLPIVGLAIVLAATAYLLTPAHYMSSATMVLTTPTSGGTLSQDPNKPTGLTNPLLNFDEGLMTTSAILIQALNTPQVAAELGTADGPTTLVVNDGSSNPNLLGVRGPFVYLEGESTSAVQARAVVLRAQQRVRDELLSRQKALNAPPITYITLVDVVPPSTPELKRATQLQLAGAAVVLTVLLGLAGAYTAERLLAARRRRRNDEEPVEPGDGPEPPEPDAVVDPSTVRFAPVARKGTNGTAVPEQVRTQSVHR